MEGETASEVCDRHGVIPSVFYRWQKELFENGAEVLQGNRRPAKEKHLERKVEALENKLSHKDEVIAEIMHEHVSLKKRFRTQIGAWFWVAAGRRDSGRGCGCSSSLSGNRKPCG